MKNIFYYLVLFYMLLISDDMEELSVVIDDSPSNLINLDVIKKICIIGLFFKMDIGIYQGKKVIWIQDMREVKNYIKKFKYSKKPFDFNNIMDKIPTNSIKVIYSDFYISDVGEELIADLANVTLITNEFAYNKQSKQKLYKLSA